MTSIKEHWNYFSGTGIDRSSDKRLNKEYLKEALCKQDTQFVVFQNCTPLVEEEEGDEKCLVKFFHAEVEKYFDLKLSGNDAKWPPYLLYMGRFDVDYFALNKLDKDWKVLEGLLTEKRSFAKGFVLATQICDKDSGLVSQAQSMFQWHDRYRFCPTCGSKMFIEEAGYKKTCLVETCRSNKGVHNTCYPRTDPTVIMIVISQNGRKCLLGRKRGWPKRMFSCLAGFMEPGESVEDAVKRETLEESGVTVSNVCYHSSQPWPFPGSLMIGCQATAQTEDIVVNEEEMDDVRWFDHVTVTRALKGMSEELILGPKQTIAHQLIKHWVENSTAKSSSL
ncbi:NAD-capped RNA hydrolase NUDT12-like isoform X1 [Clytia hemisphaerica]|uniref:NAD(+) diphosphatase n=1 Tax=Clytia hemisphaerica TaxID=252671 RepID=A0A7M5UKX1_9CNID